MVAHKTGRNADQLQALSDDVGEQRSLLVCCNANYGGEGVANRYPNLTLKKIPKMVLTKCEWGHDDYTLNVVNLPIVQPSPANVPSTEPVLSLPKGSGFSASAVKGTRPTDALQVGLFDGKE